MNDSHPRRPKFIRCPMCEVVEVSLHSTATVDIVQLFRWARETSITADLVQGIPVSIRISPFIYQVELTNSFSLYKIMYVLYPRHLKSRELKAYTKTVKLHLLHQFFRVQATRKDYWGDCLTSGYVRNQRWRP